MDEENLIRVNIPQILAAKLVKTKAEEIGGEWKLHEIPHFHGTPRNVEFTVAFENGSACLIVRGKINRETSKISKIEVRAS